MALRRSDDPDRNLAAVDPDPDVQLGAPRLPHLVRVAVDRSHDAQGCARGPIGIVLRCRRETEECGDPVAHVCVDDAAELLDRPAHSVHAASDQRREVLRLQALGEWGRTDDVGEQHAHRPQLVLGLDRGRRSVPP